MSSTGIQGATFISGGSGGIGAAIARQLALRGETVVVTYYRGREKAEVLLAEIQAAGGAAEAVGLDLRDETAVSETLAKTAANHGGLRAVICAHGPFIHMTHISKLPPQLLRETIETDSLAAYNLMHHALPHLRKSKGALVALSTAATGRYASTDILSVGPKVLIESLVKGIAVEEGRFGVRANAVGVGLLSDGMFDALQKAGSFTPDFIAKSISHIPLRRMGDSTEIAAAVAFLTSDDARYITGQVLRVDGGYSI